MAQADVRRRQNVIRDWWRTSRYNPPFLALSSTRWNGMHTIETWTDMQARIACTDHGRLLADDARWAVIREQLSYSPLWLLANLDLAISRRRVPAMERQYHVIRRVKGKLIVEPGDETMFATNIAATNPAIYTWLGLIGGERHAVPLPPAPGAEGG